MKCDDVKQKEIVEKYLLNQLDEAEAEQFEKHYLECSRCFNELQTYRALQAELSSSREAILSETSSKKLFSWKFAWAAAAAIIIVAVGIFWLVRQPFFSPAPPQPQIAKTTPESAVPHVPEVSVPEKSETPQQGIIKPHIPILTDWLNVEPPAYHPIRLRGVEDDARKCFHEAMEHYVKGNYSAAIPGLKEASSLNPQATDISFFLGACYLMEGETDSAIQELGRTISFGDTPFLEEAHFYLALAYYRAGNMKAAEEQMNKVIQLQGNLEERAHHLLGQLQSKP